MSSSGTASSSRREQLKQTLQSMQDFQLPEGIQEALSNESLDPALIARYKTARDEYMRRQLRNMFLEHISTFNGQSILEVPELPTEEEQDELEQHLDQVKSDVNKAAQGIHQQVLELQQKHTTFCMRRDELEKMVQDMENEEEQQKKKSSQGDNNNNQSMDVDIDMLDDDGDDEDAEEDALDREEERLAMLQQRKARLQVQLKQLQQENSQLEQKTEQTEAEVAEMLQGKDPPSPTSLQTETEEREQELAKLKEVQQFYDGLRQVLEELSGIQVVAVKSASNTPESSEGDEEPAVPDTIFHVRVMQKHDIQITLRSDPTKPERDFRVVAADFLTSTVVLAPVNGDSEDDSAKVLKLKIPPLDDLVKLCAMFPAREELRFLMREAMARIRMTEARVLELAVLHNNVLTRIENPQHSTDGFGAVEQEVVCSMNECITVVLRLTADCPLVPGSVYIYQMVGLGWEDETVNTIKDTVSKKEFQSPWALIQSIQMEIARLQEEEGMKIPKTPMLPSRKKNRA